ncbi:hypothetical protein [Streptomyces catenulae]|uniref:DUF3558 domain-containing protein n=1 Tax=Streptomyces catenulae TaxID=66875 RepID=A0ABV2YUZ9_9ACTN|nr:hypothetical protein [Streptomyces catenulae]
MKRTRKKALLVAAPLVLLAVALCWWFVRDTSEGKERIAFPGSVCGGVLKGSDVASLLPAEGEAFSDSRKSFGKSGNAETCSFSAGGREVELKLYYYLPSPSAAKRAENDTDWSTGHERVSIKLGDSSGYMGDHFAKLYMNCTSLLGEKSVIGVWANYYGEAAESVPPGKRAHFGDVAANALRYVSGHEGQACKEAASLPQGPPIKS